MTGKLNSFSSASSTRKDLPDVFIAFNIFDIERNVQDIGYVKVYV